MEKAIYSKDGKRVINLKARETFKTENVSFEWGAGDSKPKSKKKKKKNKQHGQQVVIDSIDLDEQSIVHGVMEAKMKAEKLERLKKSVNDTFPPSPASGLSPNMERQTIKYFWLSLTSDQRRELVQVEKEAVLNKMKRQQKNTCECDICGRKRVAIEQELETLYADYYKELDHLAESKDLPLLPLPSMGFFQADDVLRGGHQDELSEATQRLSLASTETARPLPQNLGKEIDEDGDTEEDEPYEFADDGEGMQGLDVSSVADDLLTNDGKKFIEMMERLAEKRAGRIEEIKDDDNEEGVVDDEGIVEDEEEYENDSDYSDYSSEYSQTGESLTADQRMEEGRRMFQIFAARMFEQRVLHAYKQSVAAQVKAELQQMEEEKKVLDLEKEAREEQKRERKKEKKRIAKAAKDEERKKIAAEQEERRKKEAEEAEKVRAEAERKMLEKEKEKEARRAASLAKQKARKEEQERLAREKEEARLARIHAMEEKMRLAKEKEEKEKQAIRDQEQKLEDERREKERLEEERAENARLEYERLENEKLDQERERVRLEEEQERIRLETEREQLKLEQEREKRASMSIPMSKPLPGKSQIPASQPGTSLGGLQQPAPQVAHIAEAAPQSPQHLPPGLSQPVAQSQILLDRLTPDPTSRMTPERHTPSPGSQTSNAKSLLDSLLRPAQVPGTPPSGPGTPRSSISHVTPVGAIGTIGSPGHVAPAPVTPSHVAPVTPSHVTPGHGPGHVTQPVGNVGHIGNIGMVNPPHQPISPPSTTLPVSQHRFDPWNSSYSGIASSSTAGNRLWGSSSEVPGNVIRQAALDAYEELHKNGSIDCNGFVNSRALQNTAQRYSSTGQGFGVSELFKACQGSFDIVGGLMKPRGGL